MENSKKIINVSDKTNMSCAIDSNNLLPKIHDCRSIAEQMSDRSYFDSKIAKKSALLLSKLAEAEKIAKELSEIYYFSKVRYSDGTII